MFDPFFRWVESTTVSVWINQSPSLFAFPGILAAHTVGLGLLAGLNRALDLRLLGLARSIPSSRGLPDQGTHESALLSEARIDCSCPGDPAIHRAAYPLCTTDVAHDEHARRCFVGGVGGHHSGRPCPRVHLHAPYRRFELLMIPFQTQLGTALASFLRVEGIHG